MSYPRPPLKKSEWVFLLLLFGGIFAYVAWGATAGDLAIHPRGGGEVHLRGLGAWMLVPVPIVIFTGILIRHGLFPSLGNTARGWLEFLALGLGVGLLVIACRFST